MEVADIPGSGPAVRDSKNPAGPILTLRPATFTAFLTWTVGERSQ
ncbi:DUF397 domain-containing protein [Streptomyces heliomycini]|uniref:DUF397 domain-containing protein n=1 Tax=Streptomyces heliomycini TaxID=284032 RepID=A0ABV5LGM8_9ACTN